MSHNITVGGGSSVRLPTAGKYCDRDIIITATGSATDPIIQPLEITENGTYTAPNGVDGYSPITVNVEGSGGGSEIVDALLDCTITKLESNVTTIGDSALNYRRELRSVSLPNVTSICSYAFFSSFKHTAMPTLTLPSLTSAGEYAFGQSGVYSITLPKLKEVSSCMFDTCLVLAAVDLGVATKINGGSFFGCSDIESLIIRTNSVCSLAYTTVFNSSAIKNGNGYIYVPSALVDSYKTATNWSVYAAKIRALEDYTVDGSITGKLDESKI